MTNVPFGLLGYLFMAWCIWKIAKEMNVGDEWMSWIPLLNLFIIFRIANHPVWGILLLLIPIVNIFVLGIIFMRIAERRGRLSIYGLLLFLPIINFFVLYSLTYIPRNTLVQ